MWRDLAELVRAPAAVTVPGDTLAGAVAAGWPAGRRTLLLPVASTCLYWAGMALNDYADRERDQVERPERPIPSGRVAPRTALAVATGLTAAGVAVAAVAGGRRTALTAGTLAAAVWAYDLSAKEGPLSVATMASTRGLDVLMGASAGGPDALGRALVPAGIIATHTAGVTALSRGETHGTTRATAVGCAAATAGVVVLAAQRARAAGPVAQLVAAASAGLYAAPLLRSQLLAARTPGGQQAAAATGTGIRSLVPLQATLVAGQGAPVAAGLLVAGARGLAATMRRVST